MLLSEEGPTARHFGLHPDQSARAAAPRSAGNAQENVELTRNGVSKLTNKRQIVASGKPFSAIHLSAT